MNTSVDWTTPEAYAGRMVPTPKKRGVVETALGRWRVAFRRHQRSRREAELLHVLRHTARDMPERVRRDLGLPPYG